MRRLIILSGSLALLAVTTGCPGREEAPPPPPTADPALPPVEQVEPPTSTPEETAPPATPEAPPADAPPAAPPAAPEATPPAAAPGLPTGVTTAMVQEGQRLYGGVCVACHGQNGVGTPIGPALNDQQWIHITGEYQEIVNITTTGVAQPRDYPAPMPPRGGGPFTDDQVRAISAYVYTLSHGG